MIRLLTRSGVRTLPLRVVAPLVYAVIGFLWLLGGDLLLRALPGSSELALAWLGSSNAAVFLILSAMALYALLRHIDRGNPVSATTAMATKTLLAVTVGLVVAGGYALFRLHSAAELTSWQERLNSTAAAQALHVEEWLEEYTEAVRLIAESELLEHEIEAWQADPDSERAASVLDHIEALRVLHEQQIVAIGVMSPNGHELFSSGDIALMKRDPELVIAALRARGPVFGTPYVGKTTVHEPLIAVATSVGRRDFAPAEFAMVATLNMRGALNRAVLTLGLADRRDIETLLVLARDGHTVALGSKPGASWQGLEETPGPQTGQGLAGLIAVNEHAGVARRLNYRGIEVLAVARSIPGTNWHVVVKTDWTHVLGDSLQLARLGLAVMALMALLLVTGIAWIRHESQETTAAQLADAELRIGALTEHFELANRFANDIILLVGPDGKIVQANQRAVDLYGYNRGELIGLKATALQPEGADDPGPTLRRFGDTGTLALIFETVHSRKDGSTFPVEVSARRFEINGEKFSQAIVRDVSKRKEDEAERERITSERDRMAERIRAQFDSNPLPCAISDTEHLIVDVNPAFEKLFGWKEEELVGQDNLGRLVAADDIEDAKATLQSIEQSTSPVVSTHRNITRDGRTLTCRWTDTALLDTRGKFVGIYSVCEDLSNELSLRRTVAEREAAFGALAETAPVGVFQLDRTGAVTFANQMLVHMFGMEPQAIGQLPRGLYLGPEDRPRAGGLLREALAGVTPPPQEFRYAGPGGTNRWVLIHACPVIDDAGKVLRVVGTATDITSQKQQELELERRVAERTEEYRVAKERAERADAVKMDFLAAMSHELRTPLNSIVGFSEVLLEKTVGPLNERQEQQLIIVRNAAHRQRALISDLLDISRIETGRLEINRGPVAIGELVRRSAQEFELEARGRGLELRAVVGPGLDGIVTDGAKVQQILSNFLSNAIKYTTRGSVLVKAKRVDGDALLSVADTGPGIAHEEQSRIFEPFVQLKSKSGPLQRGVGLGLAISRRLAIMLGGSIEVESSPGIGSTFRLRLPIDAGRGTAHQEEV